MSLEPEDAAAAIEARHAEKMRKKQAAQAKIMADKTREKGLLIVHTGKGKGKTSAALGMVVRAIGHGMKVGVVQFVKGAMQTGEARVFAAFPDMTMVKHPFRAGVKAQAGIEF